MRLSTRLRIPASRRRPTRPDAGCNPTNSCRSSGGSVRDTPHPEPGNPMATLGRRLPRIVCVRLGSTRHFVELKVVRRLLSLWPLMEWAVVFFPVLSAAAGYLRDGVHVQEIARAFAKWS